MHTARCSKEQEASSFGGDASLCDTAPMVPLGFTPVSPQFHPELSTGRANLSTSAWWVHCIYSFLGLCISRVKYGNGYCEQKGMFCVLIPFNISV